MSQLISLLTGQPQRLYNDPWHPAASSTEHTRPILLLAQYRQENHPDNAALCLTAADEPEELEPWIIQQCPLIVLDFASFTDGRAYSQAAVLRRRLHYRGDLRASGDVLRDQLVLMQQCGFTSFLIRADKSAEDAIRGLQRFRYGFGQTAC
jgi:uncharacterized protein (DUF934 family)